MSDKKQEIKKKTRKKKSVEIIDNTLCIEMDQVYKAINKVQETREVVTFVILDSISATVNNILKDIGLPFKHKKAKSNSLKCVSYTVSPGKKVSKIEHLSYIEELKDEILEDGQVFL